MSKSKPQRSKKGSTTGKSTTGTRRRSATATSATSEEKGKRAGSKRSDRRWIDPTGALWASKFEYEVYEELRGQLWLNTEWTIERCGPSDTLGYNTSVKNGRCTQCQSTCTVQERTYTPDLVLVRRVQGQEARRVYIEAKGYFEGTKRNLFRQVVKAHSDVDIRLVAGADHWVTKGKSRISDWAKRYKVKMYLWKDLKLEELLK